jgi:hypothetical protein
MYDNSLYICDMKNTIPRRAIIKFRISSLILLSTFSLAVTTVSAQKYFRFTPGKADKISLPQVMQVSNAGSINETNNPDLFVVLKFAERLCDVLVYSRNTNKLIVAKSYLFGQTQGPVLLPAARQTKDTDVYLLDRSTATRNDSVEVTFSDLAGELFVTLIVEDFDKAKNQLNFRCVASGILG